MNSLRRYDLDWLRVFAVLLLIPFHSALIFVLNPLSIMYIKDTINNPFLDQAAGFVHQWHMPLLFFISGAASWFSLRKRNAGTYITERVQRLLVPLLFGTIVLLPPMTYIHLIGQKNTPTFWQHYINFFHINLDDISGMSGGITPAHLWFILFLFVFSFIAVPLFIWIRNSVNNKPVPEKKWFNHPALLYIWFIPLTLLAALNILGDKNPLYYFLLFVLGFISLANGEWHKQMQRVAWLSLGLAITASILHYIFHDGLYADVPMGWMLSGSIYHAARWIWVMAFIGLAGRYLNKGNNFLSYANRAAFPFYILHLPVNTFIGWLIIKLQISIGLKYILIVIISTLLTWLIYEFIVKRVRFLRYVMGIK